MRERRRRRATSGTAQVPWSASTRDADWRCPPRTRNDMLLRTRVLLRGTLLAAAAHSALAQTCASYCHWDIKNCLVSEQHCRGCDACVAAAAKSGPTDGCYSWCSAAQDHCAKEKAKCGGCDFCGGQSAPCSPKVGGDREYLSCEGWCSEVRPPRTHTPRVRA